MRPTKLHPIEIQEIKSSRNNANAYDLFWRYPVIIVGELEFLRRFYLPGGGIPDCIARIFDGRYMRRTFATGKRISGCARLKP